MRCCTLKCRRSSTYVNSFLLNLFLFLIISLTTKLLSNNQNNNLLQIVKILQCNNDIILSKTYENYQLLAITELKESEHIIED